MKHPRSPGRLLRRAGLVWLPAIAGLLLLGSAANVGVACWCSLWSRVKWTALAVSGSSTRYWRQPTICEEETRVMPFRCAGFGIDGQQTDELQSITRAHGILDFGVMTTGGSRSRAEFRAGWPVRCLAWSRACQEQWEQIDGTERRPKWYEASGVVPPYTVMGRRLLPRPLVAPSGVPLLGPAVLLPTRPIWTGVAINTVYWTGMVAILVFAPAMIRRLRRQRAGLCPTCGYDLAGLGVGAACPECGKVPFQPSPSRERGGSQ